MEQNIVTINVNRLNALRGFLLARADAYYKAVEAGRDLSVQMYGWIDEYDDLRTEPGWEAYCEIHGSDLGHHAVDLFA